MKLTKTQIEKAVNWWAEVIQNPKMDNGDDSPTGGMVVMLAMMNIEPVTASQVNDFKSSLNKLLETEEHPELSVDYGPSELISKALRDADITASNAPWKTNMWFNNTGVQVKYGYRAEMVEL